MVKFQCSIKKPHRNESKCKIFVSFAECKAESKIETSNDQKDPIQTIPDDRPQSSNTKQFSCSNCKKDFYLTSVEILKHRKSCRSTAE